MMSTLKKFLKKKKVRINCEKKTKCQYSTRKKKRKKKNRFRIKKKLEEVQCFKYLEFMFNNKKDYGAHIKELAKKRRTAAYKVQGLGERICKDNWNRKQMFNCIVRNVMSYGTEIWG